MKPIYVTGNENKARLFNKMLGIDLEHARVDVEEIQSLDIREVVEHKARSAFAELKRPVIVEDTQLTFSALGKLPGPLIKWFIDELGDVGLCRMLNAYDDRSATAGAAMAYYDGRAVQIFESSRKGEISKHSQGDNGFGWNSIFIPSGKSKTLGEMNDVEFHEEYLKIKPFEELRRFLDKIEA